MPARSESESQSRPGAGRFLFVIPPWPGHIYPTIAVVHELMDRGHVVAWAGHRRPLVERLPPGSPIISVGDEIPAGLPEPGKLLRGPAGQKITWEDYIVPYALKMLDGVHAAVDEFDPDVLVVDQQTIAGMAVAELRGLPWATSATSPAGLVDWVGVGKMREWFDTLLRDFLLQAGLDEERATQLDPLNSPHLVIAYTIPEIVGRTGFPDNYALVGPPLEGRHDDTPFPWEWLDQGSGPCVLVSLGSMLWRSGERFFKVATEAIADMADMQVRAVIVAPDHLVPDPPPNVLVREHVPQLDLLPRVDAVVCHGGHNTVCEALIQGLPLVIAPLQNDQPMIADAVAQAGAGLRVKFFREKPATLRRALEEVLTKPSYRAAAARMGASLEAAGGAAAAADRLEALLVEGREGRDDRQALVRR